MEPIINVSKHKNAAFLPKNLKIKIVDFKEIDKHLYSFRIEHKSTKYVEIGSVLCYEKKHFIHELTIVEELECGNENITSSDYIEGKVKGGCVSIDYDNEKIRNIFIKTIPLKYETLVYVILQYKDEN